MMPSLREALLAPYPKSVEDAPGVFRAGPGTRVEAAPGAERVAEFLKDDLGGLGGSSAGRIRLVLEGDGNPERHTIDIGADCVAVSSSAACGLFRGCATLRQLLVQGAGEIPCGRIADEPAFAHRGYMLDASRCKVPTMETLLAFIEVLARFKYNHFQLYIEHVFAYSAHHAVWEHASPFTPEEIRTIDSFCRERFIEFVPNQNSLGHMERWLEHPGYARLAECPEGFQDPWSPDWRGPSTISPVLDDSLALVEGLYEELLPNFSSGLFNTGCDEPFELGRGRSKRACEERGKGRVYLEWLLALRAACAARGKRMLFWADIINEHPELVPELPQDMVPLEWGYDAGHPWDEHCARFAGAGLDFFVCPGTSTWNSVAGRTGNTLANLREAAEAGARHGAMGYLVTEWGDFGHRQFLPVNYLPMVAAASCAWNPGGGCAGEAIRATALHVFGDRSGDAGQWLADFGNLYLCDPSPPMNHSRFFMLLHPRDGRTTAEKLSLDDIRRANEKLDRLGERLACLCIERADADLIHRELELSVDFLKHACHRGLAIKTGREREQEDGLACELAPLIVRYRELWAQRNRPGGLDASVRLLDSLQDEYSKDSRRGDLSP